MHKYQCSVATGFILLLLQTLAIEAQDAAKSGNEQAGSQMIGGTEAKQEDCRHQVSIRIKEHDRTYGYGEGHHCGGSLIGPDSVLTAAHCFDHDKPDEFKVVLGSVDRLNKDNLSFKITSVTIHPAYDAKHLFNDIAVVHLSSSVPSDNTNIKPIEINRKSIAAGTICQVTGWGLMINSTQDFQMAPKLLSVDVPLVPECKDTKIKKEELNAGMICAGDLKFGGMGSCLGDPGGPLVCNGLLTGIVSWGVTQGCEEPDLPGVYTKVEHFKDWIDEQVVLGPSPQVNVKPISKTKKGEKRSGAENLSPIVSSMALGVVAIFLRL